MHPQGQASLKAGGQPLGGCLGAEAQIFRFWVNLLGPRAEGPRKILRLLGVGKFLGLGGSKYRPPPRERGGQAGRDPEVPLGR
jgi:hypothetical protein